MSDFSITGFLEGLGQAKPESKPEKSKKKRAKPDDSEPVTAPVTEKPDAVVLATAFQASSTGGGPQLAPAAAVSSKSKKRRHSIDDVLGDCTSGSDSEQEKETSGRQGKKRAVVKDSAEKIARTVYIGNLCSTVKPKEIKRLMNAVLSGRKGPLDNLIKPPSAGKDDEEGGSDEDLPDLDDLSEGDILSDEEGDVEETNATKSARNAVESVRLRSVPITGTRVASGSSYKVMKKACVIQGVVDTALPAAAYVVFKTSDDAQNVLSLNGQLLKGRHLRVDLAGGSETTKDASLSVFVGNLPFTASEEQLRALFASKVDDGDDCITNVRIVRDKVTNKAKGVAYIAFKERVNVFQALALHDTEFAGRTLRVSHCKSEARLGKGHAGGFQGLRQTKLAASKRLKTSKHQQNRKEDRARKAKKRERKANKMEKKANKPAGKKPSLKK